MKLFMFIAAGVVLSLACSTLTPQKDVAIATGAFDVFKCVIDHETETPEQIAKDCAGTTLVDVTNILALQKRTELRHMNAMISNAHSPDAGGDSGTITPCKDGGK